MVFYTVAAGDVRPTLLAALVELGGWLAAVWLGTEALASACAESVHVSDEPGGSRPR